MMFNMLMRKVSHYKLDSWKRHKKIRDFRKKESRVKRDKFLSSFKISIFEFPYYMRIRCNYRDLAFIENVSTAYTARYFKEYLVFTHNMVRIIDTLKNQLVEARRGKPL